MKIDETRGKERYQSKLLEHQSMRALIDSVSNLGYMRERLHAFISRGENPPLDLLGELYDQLVAIDSVVVTAIEAEKTVQRNLLQSAPKVAVEGLQIIPTDSISRLN